MLTTGSGFELTTGIGFWLGIWTVAGAAVWLACGAGARTAGAALGGGFGGTAEPGGVGFVRMMLGGAWLLSGSMICGLGVGGLSSGARAPWLCAAVVGTGTMLGTDAAPLVAIVGKMSDNLRRGGPVGDGDGFASRSLAALTISRARALRLVFGDPVPRILAFFP